MYIFLSTPVITLICYDYDLGPELSTRLEYKTRDWVGSQFVICSKDVGPGVSGTGTDHTTDAAKLQSTRWS